MKKLKVQPIKALEQIKDQSEQAFSRAAQRMEIKIQDWANPDETKYYINNPESCFYYQGRNLAKQFAKLILRLEHYCGTLHDEAEKQEIDQIIKENRELAQELRAHKKENK